jgi:chromosome segregation ATPase
LLPQHLPWEVWNASSFQAEHLSALFIWSMLSLCLVMLLQVALRFRQTNQALGQLRQTVRAFPSEQPPPPAFHSLWSHFLQRHVRALPEAPPRSDLEPAYVFSWEALAPAFANNRLYAAMPGIFTALGVLGTFVGLQLGLKSIDLTQRVTDQQIQPLIQGAAVAFSTSVWGVVTSVLFNVLEKNLERRLRQRVQAVQALLAETFPLQTAEALLWEVHSRLEQVETHAAVPAQHTPEMLRIFQHLEALALTAVEEKHQSVEERVAQSIDRFTEALWATGQQQQELIGRSTDALERGAQAMHQEMSTFLREFDQRVQRWSAEHEHMSDLSQNLIQHSAQLLQQEQTTSQLLNESSEQLTKSAKSLQKATQALESHHTQLEQVSGSFGKRIEKAAAQVASSADLNARAAETFQKTQQELEPLRSQFQDLQRTVRNDTQELGAQFGKLVKQLARHVENLEDQYQQNQHDVAQVLQDHQELSKQQLTAQQALDSTTQQLQHSAAMLSAASSELAQFRDAVHDSVAQWSQQQAQAETLRQQTAEQNQHALQTQQHISEQLTGIVRQTDAVGRYLETLGQTLDGSVRNLGTHLNGFVDRFGGKIEDWTRGQDSQHKEVEQLLQRNQETARLMRDAQQHMERIARAVETTSGKFASSTSNLDTLSSRLGHASESLGRKQVEAARVTDNAAQRNQQVAEDFRKLFMELDGLRRDFQSTQAALKSSGQQAGDSFQRLVTAQTEMLDGWNRQMERLSLQLTEQTPKLHQSMEAFAQMVEVLRQVSLMARNLPEGSMTSGREV